MYLWPDMHTAFRCSNSALFWQTKFQIAFFICWWGGEFLVNTHTKAPVKLWHENVSIAIAYCFFQFSRHKKVIATIDDKHLYVVDINPLVDESENSCMLIGKFIFVAYRLCNVLKKVRHLQTERSNMSNRRLVSSPAKAASC